MIGIIEKVVIDCLLEAGGEELCQDVLFAAGIPTDRVYRMDQHYPDSETAQLIEAALLVTKLAPQQFFDLFAILFFDMVEQVFPEFLRMSESSEDLVRKQIKIHAIMAAGCRAIEDTRYVTDKFQLVDKGRHDIEVHYRSELRLCGLYETLVRFAADKFGDTVEFASHKCMNDGHEACVMGVRWTSIAGTPTHFYKSVSPKRKRGHARG